MKNIITVWKTKFVLTGCHFQPDVPVSQCPPCWWTPWQRLGPRTAWRALSGPPGERRYRGTGSSPGADEQHVPISHKKKTSLSPTRTLSYDFKAVPQVGLNKTRVKGKKCTTTLYVIGQRWTRKSVCKLKIDVYNRTAMMAKTVLINLNYLLKNDQVKSALDRKSVV